MFASHVWSAAYKRADGLPQSGDISGRCVDEFWKIAYAIPQVRKCAPPANRLRGDSVSPVSPRLKRGNASLATPDLAVDKLDLIKVIHRKARGNPGKNLD
jgi:hypothetical protein